MSAAQVEQCLREYCEAAVAGIAMRGEFDERVVADASAVLSRVAGGRGAVDILGYVFGRKLVGYAAAAMVIVGILLGAIYLWPVGEQGDVATEGIVREEQTEQVVEAPVAADVAEARELFAAGDIAGLIAMLGSDNAEARAAAANYLAEIGDVSAITPLEELSSEWSGEGKNPYDAAIEKIKAREQTGESPQTHEVLEAKPEEMVERSVFDGPGMLIYVLDEQTREPIPGVKLNIGRHFGVPEESWKSWEESSNEHGWCRLDFKDGTPAFLSIWAGGVPAYVPMHAMWHEDMDKPEEFEFLLARGTIIGGRVESKEGKAIGGAKVAVTIPVEPPRGMAYVCIEDYGANTDASGRWSLDIIPADAEQIQLQLSHRKYRDDREPRKPGDGYTSEQLRRGEAVLVMEPARILLSGMVTDAKTGEPITDAQVEIWGGPIETAKTDANGFYFFEEEDVQEEGEYRMKVVSREYFGITDYDKLPSIQLGKRGHIVKDFQLERACMVEIRVVDEEGNPVENAQLSAASLGDPYGREVSRYAGGPEETDANGLILLGGFEPSENAYLIIATHSVRGETRVAEDGMRYTETHLDYAPGKLVVTLNDPEVIEYGEIVLKRGVETKGYIEYADGVPATDVKISAYPDWWHGGMGPGSCEVDEEGNFTLKQIVPGMYRIHVMIPQGTGMWTGKDVTQVQLPLGDAEVLRVKIPEKSPQSLVSISGGVRFPTGAEASYVHITAYSQKGVHRHISLDRNRQTGQLEEGFVVDRLEPGTYRLTFDGENMEQKVIEGVEAPSEGLVVELEYATKPKLEGTAVDSETGQAVGRFRVRARKNRTLRGPNYVQSDRWHEFNDEQGAFEIEVVGPGSYQVQVAAEGFAWVWSKEINTDENVPVVVELTEGGGIRGRVINEAGERVDDAKVIPLSKAGGTMPRVKEEFVSEEGAAETVGGEFELKNLAAGVETLKAAHPDYAFSIVRDVEVKEGEVTEGVEIVLGKGAAVEGYVYDVQGRPQAGETLCFQDDSGYGGTMDEEAGRLTVVTTDANGHYHVEKLPEQLCFVWRQNQWSALGVVRRAIVPQQGKMSRLDFGAAPVISGRVVFDGVPLANHRVELCGTDNAHFGTFRSFDVTGAGGEFVFRGTPKGKWSIYYERQDGGSNWTKIATIDVGDEDMALGNIPERVSTVRVYVEYEGTGPRWDISRAYMREGSDAWGQEAGETSEPNSEGEPYVVRNVAAGTHTFVLRRADNVMLREVIEVGLEDVNVTIPVPQCTAGLSGRLTDGLGGWQTVWRRDKGIVGYIRADAEGNYRIENLPAGEYLVGGNMLMDEGAIETFTLSEGEQKVLDIHVSRVPRQKVASLLAMVLSEHGVPIPGVDVWLEGDRAVIEPLQQSSEEAYFVAEPGRYVLCAWYPGYKEVRQEVMMKLSDPRPRRELPKEYVRLQRKE